MKIFNSIPFIRNLIIWVIRIIIIIIVNNNQWWCVEMTMSFFSSFSPSFHLFFFLMIFFFRSVTFDQISKVIIIGRSVLGEKGNDEVSSGIHLNQSFLFSLIKLKSFQILIESRFEKWNYFKQNVPIQSLFTLKFVD